MKKLLANEKQLLEDQAAATKEAMRQLEKERGEAVSLRRSIAAYQREREKSDKAAEAAKAWRPVDDDPMDTPAAAWQESNRVHWTRKWRAVTRVWTALHSSCDAVVSNMVNVVQSVVRRFSGTPDKVIEGMLSPARQRALALYENMALRIQGAYRNLRVRRSLNEQRAVRIVLVAASGGATSVRATARFLDAGRTAVTAAFKLRAEIDHQRRCLPPPTRRVPLPLRPFSSPPTSNDHYRQVR